MENNGIWQETFRIDASMVDTTRKATLMSICNFLQVTAGNHAHTHQLGFDDMNANHQFWALNRLKVQMETYPDWRSQITIHTWVHLMKGPFSYRNFEIFENNRLIGHAATLWVALNSKTRRPIKINNHSLPIIAKIPKTGEPPKIKFAPNEQEIKTFQHQVVYSDLDMINHVNNVKYTEWILNSYGSNRKKSSPKLLEINYLSETHASQTALVQTFSENDNIDFHEIKIQETNKAAVRAKLEWH